MRRQNEAELLPVYIHVPLVPPSVNHYVKHTRSGHHYVSDEAKAFKEAVVLYARGRQIRSKSYGVVIDVYLGFGQKGDVDNFAKVVLDGLVEAGVIDSDAKVVELFLRKMRDSHEPRTEIKVYEP